MVFRLDHEIQFSALGLSACNVWLLSLISSNGYTLVMTYTCICSFMPRRVGSRCTSRHSRRDSTRYADLEWSLDLDKYSAIDTFDLQSDPNMT